MWPDIKFLPINDMLDCLFLRLHSVQRFVYTASQKTALLVCFCIKYGETSGYSILVVMNDGCISL